jgi:hypothetical protein
MAKLTKPARDQISATKFAFPKQRKEPLENASHVRNAVARFNQVKGVTEVERRAAWKRIQSAAKRYGVELHRVRTARTCHVARLPSQQKLDCLKWTGGRGEWHIVSESRGRPEAISYRPESAAAYPI